MSSCTKVETLRAEVENRRQEIKRLKQIYEPLHVQVESLRKLKIRQQYGKNDAYWEKALDTLGGSIDESRQSATTTGSAMKRRSKQLQADFGGFGVNEVCIYINIHASD
jgi:hypothetical protein